MIAKSFLGIFVNPVDVQSEGLHRVFDNIQAAGATAIVLLPHAVVRIDGAAAAF